MQLLEKLKENGIIKDFSPSGEAENDLPEIWYLEVTAQNVGRVETIMVEHGFEYYGSVGNGPFMEMIFIE